MSIGKIIVNGEFYIRNLSTKQLEGETNVLQNMLKAVLHRKTVK